MPTSINLISAVLVCTAFLSSCAPPPISITDPAKAVSRFSFESAERTSGSWYESFVHNVQSVTGLSFTMKKASDTSLIVATLMDNRHSEVTCFSISGNSLWKSTLSSPGNADVFGGVVTPTGYIDYLVWEYNDSIFVKAAILDFATGTKRDERTLHKRLRAWGKQQFDVVVSSSGERLAVVLYSPTEEDPNPVHPNFTKRTKAEVWLYDENLRLLKHEPSLFLPRAKEARRGDETNVALTNEGMFQTFLRTVDEDNKRHVTLLVSTVLGSKPRVTEVEVPWLSANGGRNNLPFKPFDSDIRTIVRHASDSTTAITYFHIDRGEVRLVELHIVDRRFLSTKRVGEVVLDKEFLESHGCNQDLRQFPSMHTSKNGDVVMIFEDLIERGSKSFIGRVSGTEFDVKPGPIVVFPHGGAKPWVSRVHRSTDMTRTIEARAFTVENARSFVTRIENTLHTFTFSDHPENGIIHTEYDVATGLYQQPRRVINVDSHTPFYPSQVVVFPEQRLLFFPAYEFFVSDKTVQVFGFRF